ncbi:hypothetical protein INT44_006430 [Umbelopsis vinacea]|uniref:GST N-terminal domain-containing protein n=1 Tax=Umbelopsis vinacea TaxID=44442 RepID=A0A8H7PSX0_9FUNG|nr:hypothetical protein INT44_006430 [Umbelopsis vinacea]
MATPPSALYILNRNYSSWSLRAWLAVRFVNYPCEVKCLYLDQDRDLFSPQANEILKQAGPTGKVPTIHTYLDGEKIIIHESLAIVEFLAEDYPQLWPSGKADRALARAISAEMASSFGSLRNNYPMNIRAHYPFVKSYYEATPGIARDLARITSIFVTCRERVQKRDDLKKIDEGFLFGAFTAADAMYAPVCFRIKSMSLPISDPVAKEYIETLCNYGIVQEWVKEALKETQILPSDEVQFPSE